MIILPGVLLNYSKGIVTLIDYNDMVPIQYSMDVEYFAYALQCAVRNVDTKCEVQAVFSEVVDKEETNNFLTTLSIECTDNERVFLNEVYIISMEQVFDIMSLIYDTKTIF